MNENENQILECSFSMQNYPPRLFYINLVQYNYLYIGKETKKQKLSAAKVEEQRENGKKRTKKDKNAPKKPMSPFFCY